MRRKPSDLAEFPFLFGGAFIEAQQRVTRLRLRQFIYSFGGTFFEVGELSSSLRGALEISLLFVGTFIEAATCRRFSLMRG